MSLEQSAVPDDDLDGHTIEELGDYLERGREPYDPSIENSAACRLALSGLTRLSELSARALVRQAALDPGRDDSWITSLLDTIKSEVRSGRDVPISHPDPRLRLALTEAAVRGIIRRAGDTMGGVIMGRCSLEGDISTPGEIVRIDVSCALEYGEPVDAAVGRLRTRIRHALSEHTELVIGEIDIAIADIYLRHE